MNNLDWIKPRPGLIDPHFMQSPLFKDLKMLYLFNNYGTSYHWDDVRREATANTSYGGPQWLQGKYGPETDYDNNECFDSGLVATGVPFGRITCVAWCATTSSSGTRLVLGARPDSNDYCYFGSSSGSMYCLCRVAGSYSPITQAVTGSHNGEIGMWAYTGTPEGQYLFFNGKQVASTGANGTSNSGSGVGYNWWVGDRGYSSADAWDGQISSCGVFYRGLSHEEIYELYRRGPGWGINRDSIEEPIYGAAVGGGVNFNPAFAVNSNQLM